MKGAVLFTALVTALPAAAEQSPEFPKSASFIIQLTSSQYSSGFGEYLVPPLNEAFRKTGMRYEGGPGADFAATIESGSDVGKWYGDGDAAKWLYERFVTVGLTPSDVDVEPEGRLAPRFSVTVQLITPNEDRVDELDCLIALATRELSFRYRAAGHVTVNGKGCARK
ncbi:MAG TPA: hypothetical protein PLI43_11000 [Albidovulum sp.]|uniref:hypothetical protein n=1 Tax=Albidovulum sp. TaxID=1872424 RepID=UPI002BE678BA|nr:hypothetical protein [Albidovulum sp.]